MSVLSYFFLAAFRSSRTIRYPTQEAKTIWFESSSLPTRKSFRLIPKIKQSSQWLWKPRVGLTVELQRKRATKWISPFTKIPTQGTNSMLFETRKTQQTKYLSSETLRKGFIPVVTQRRESVFPCESELKVPFARFGFSNFWSKENFEWVFNRIFFYRWKSFEWGVYEEIKPVVADKDDFENWEISMITTTWIFGIIRILIQRTNSTNSQSMFFLWVNVFQFNTLMKETKAEVTEANECGYRDISKLKQIFRYFWLSRLRCKDQNQWLSHLIVPGKLKGYRWECDDRNRTCKYRETWIRF